ncbi:hypothetical protein JD844_024776 [Phrynosoma platyrhinos]|uniref:Kinesin motor domain-containing protein n=1 Tax=Phrynosoma platyrhinos TaxID=52577 RepID=A0ABQ7SYB8_PHRPL|nr:hypothetical protein JD844_024776 [Phrynosoma platyrhinos]
MRPGGGGGISLSFVAEQRIRQLEQKLRAKEERIIMLKTENALLHLKLAESQQTIRNISDNDSDHFTFCRKQNYYASARSMVIQLYRAIQRLKQDMKNLRLSALQFSRDIQQQGKSFFYQILSAIQRLQLHNETIEIFQTKALELEQSLYEVSERYQKEKQWRKILHNSLVELRGNIRVHCRIRPLLPFDTPAGESVLEDRQINISEKVVRAADDETVIVKCSRPGHALINKMFQYERYNVCIMAYGQTGSGKTYTMLGPQLEENVALSVEEESELGIIPRATEEVFRLLSEKPLGSCLVEVSVVEVYNNEVFDLLAKDNFGRPSGVKRDIITNKEGKSDVPLLTYEPVEDAEEVLEIVNKGLQLRVKHPTLVHAHSSRSHLVVTLTVTTVLPEDDFGMSGVTGSVLRETSFINRSLSALADVLGAISEHRSHVPYRNSKLTHLLQDSIGGDAKLLLMLCVSPSQKYVTESLQTLGFGSRARQVQRGQAKKRNPLALSKSK